MTHKMLQGLPKGTTNGMQKGPQGHTIGHTKRQIRRARKRAYQRASEKRVCSSPPPCVRTSVEYSGVLDFFYCNPPSFVT